MIDVTSDESINVNGGTVELEVILHTPPVILVAVGAVFAAGFIVGITGAAIYDHMTNPT